MQIYELNPGDVIRYHRPDWMVNVFGRDISKENFEVHHLKLNDSFPEAVIQVPVIKKQTDVNGKEFVVSERWFTYGVESEYIQLVEHRPRNAKRWNWIVNRVEIGDNYPTLYNSVIANNEYAKYNWQTWGNDGFYHCPFCDKKLNSVKDIEETDTNDINVTLKKCNCEDWKHRETAYEAFLSTKMQLRVMESSLLGDSELEEFKRDR